MTGPARNRVTPFGDIEAFPLRGAFTGNRGILHRGREIVRYHAHDAWITCGLTFKDRWNEQWIPHRLTWLYFYDEAVSLAAGHRPCAECRRTSYNQYRGAWTEAAGGPPPSASEINRQLHRERIVPGTHRRQWHIMPWDGLPDGTFVDLDGAPWLVVGTEVVLWTREGYQTRRPRPLEGTATVITPPSNVAVLGAGYPVQLDASSGKVSPQSGASPGTPIPSTLPYLPHLAPAGSADEPASAPRGSGDRRPSS